MSLNSKSDAKVILNTYATLLSANNSGQFHKQMLETIKAQNGFMEMLKRISKTKKKPFS